MNNKPNESTPAEVKPMIITQYFMADWVPAENRDDESGWCIFRLLDFCNPALPDGPQSLYCLSDEQQVRELMAALDGVCQGVIEREGKRELAA